MHIEPGSKLELGFWVVVLLASTALGLAVLYGMTLWLAWALGDLVAAAIVAAAAPIIASLSLAIWDEHAAQRQAVEQQRREERRRAYRDLLAYLAEAVDKLDDETDADGYALEPKRQSEFARQLLMWGNDELIELWNDFREADFNALSPKAKREWYGRLLKQVRRELRGNNTAMEGDELYELYAGD